MEYKKEIRSYVGPPGITLGDSFHRTTGSGVKDFFCGRQVVYTHKGRCGLGLLCMHWKLNPGDMVLMPAYNCGTELDPFIQYGLKVVFYRVNIHAQIDFDDLLKRVTPTTKIIYITHYFGWPQDVHHLSDYCRKNNIYLIEDCALSLFSKPVDQPIGVIGDAAIYSFAKTLPVPDGGALTLPDKESQIELPTKTPSFQSILKGMLPLIKRTVLRYSDKAGLYRYLPIKFTHSRLQRQEIATTPAGFPEIPPSYYFNKAIEQIKASGPTRFILFRSCQKYIIKQRRENYLKLLDSVKTTKYFEPLYLDMPEGLCPLHLPVIATYCKSACIRLNEMGIAAMQWWAGYHRSFDWVEFPEARHLKEHILTIPIHQQLSPDNIKYIYAAILDVGNTRLGREGK